MARPAHLQHDVPLAPHTTLGVGGPARLFADVEDAAHLAALVRWAREAGERLFILGGGSNVVISDAGLDGLVLRLRAEGRALAHRDGGTRLVQQGGSSWPACVEAVVQEGLCGIECLAGIPGSSGAVPVQNVGAYGQEVAQTLVAVDVVDLRDGAQQTLAAADCGLGYRTSHFRGRWAGRFAIVAIHLQLRRGVPAPPAYPELARACAAAGSAAQTPAGVAAQVLRLRRAKSMVWDEADPNARSVGSFFVNPVLGGDAAAGLAARCPGVPLWPQPAVADADAAGAPQHKASAAWLIEAAGLRRGWRSPAAGGRVGLSARHALALINCGGARAADVVAAAAEVHARVLAHSGVDLHAEARPLGFPPLGAPFDP